MHRGKRITAANAFLQHDVGVTNAKLWALAWLAGMLSDWESRTASLAASPYWPAMQENQNLKPYTLNPFQTCGYDALQPALGLPVTCHVSKGPPEHQPHELSLAPSHSLPLAPRSMPLQTTTTTV